MQKKVDLTGQRFGRLTAERFEYRNNGFDYYLCKCDCGNEKTIRSYSLQKGITKSCGCLQREKAVEANTRDIVGKKFGRLTPVKRINKRGSNIYWEFQCDCGNRVVTQKTAVQSGWTRSCGCLQKDKARNWIIKSNKDINWVENTDLLKLTDKPQGNNTSGVRGVSWDKSRGKWLATITFQGEHMYLGRFDKLEDATRARREAEEKYFHPMLEKYKRPIKK